MVWSASYFNQGWFYFKDTDIWQSCVLLPCQKLIVYRWVEVWVKRWKVVPGQSVRMILMHWVIRPKDLVWLGIFPKGQQSPFYYQFYEENKLPTCIFLSGKFFSYRAHASLEWSVRLSQPSFFFWKSSCLLVCIIVLRYFSSIQVFLFVIN